MGLPCPRNAAGINVVGGFVCMAVRATIANTAFVPAQVGAGIRPPGRYPCDLNADALSPEGSGLERCTPDASNPQQKDIAT